MQFFYNINCEGYELCETTNTCVDETVTETDTNDNIDLIEGDLD